MSPQQVEHLEIDGHEVTITNPGKLFFKEVGVTKLDLVHYYLAVSEGALLGVRDRPMALKRFVDGADGQAFFQKRAPANLPPYVRTVELAFPSGRTADEVVVDNAAALAWVINLGCIDLNPHPVRSGDLDHPDELRVDLDPGPGVSWADVRSVAMVVREVLDDLGCTGWPKTSGSRGMHVYVRIEPRWPFGEVRRAALALAREVERRAPGLATSKWWKEERQGVFLDYNQNAKDRTVASVYSVRPRADASVSAPLTWDEVPTAELGDFTVFTMRDRYARVGDVGAGIDERSFPLEPFLELVARHEAEGLGDAPWPPHYAKQAGEPPRVQPSKRRLPDADHVDDLRAPRGSRGSASGEPRLARRSSQAGDPRPPTDPTAPRGRLGSVAPPIPSASYRRPDGTVSPTGRRRSTQPLLVISQAADKSDALAGLDRWRARHPEAAANVRDPEDVLVDAMRGRSSVWWRVRVNLRNVPEAQRPAAEPPDPDYDPWEGYR